MLTRRATLVAGAVGALATAGVIEHWWRRRERWDPDAALPASSPEVVAHVGQMPYRRFGATGLEVSELGFGAWAIGGKAYGAVDPRDARLAFARAEELGCNLVDTAMVYGDSETVIGEFMRTRRSRWIIATKYSFQGAGLTATLEQQLRRLGTDVIDFYQLHSLPESPGVYDELYRAKKAGKVRFVGASIYTARDIDTVIAQGLLDGVQLPFNLLEPEPFLLRVAQLRRSRLAVLVRSPLREGFLAGKFRRDATFTDPNDQRHSWSAARIAATVDAVERFRFLSVEAGTMVRAAVAYTLSFPEVSAVLLGTKTFEQADSNFSRLPGARLSTASLRQIGAIQREREAGEPRSLRALVKQLLGLRP